MRFSSFLFPISLLALCAAFAQSCGPDAPPLECTEPHPSFDILIVAPDGPLPPDTVVAVKYGGGTEKYPGPRQIVFCEPSAADGGAPPPMGTGGEPSAGGAAGEPNGGAAGSPGASAGAGGEGGAAPRATAPLAGIRCQLWTQGPATVTVDTKGLYAADEHELRVSSKVCTVVETIELERPDDAGMM